MALYLANQVPTGFDKKDGSELILYETGSYFFPAVYNGYHI